MSKVDIYPLLQKKYPANEFVLMAEVSNAAGFGRTRSADFIVVNLWPSRGNSIIGIERKSFRGDWLNELKNPKKQEEHFKFCDYFYLLTDEESIAHLHEIPVTWGWMCVKGGKIHVKKEAPKLDPVALTRGFIVSMLRRAAAKEDFVHRDSIKDEIKIAADNAVDKFKNTAKFNSNAYDELKKRVQEFEQSSGVEISRWSGDNKRIGEAVRFVMNHGTQEQERSLKQLHRNLSGIVTSIQDALKNLNNEQGNTNTIQH
jgi:hypothetical protein